MYKCSKVALICHYLGQCRLWCLYSSLSMSGKLSTRPLYSWVLILHKSTDVTRAKLSFRLKLQPWSAQFVRWVLQTPACLCCILICAVISEDIWRLLKLDLSFTGDPIFGKWQQVFVTTLQQEDKCYDDPCIVLLFSMLDFPCSPQPSVYLSPDSSFSQ